MDLLDRLLIVVRVRAEQRHRRRKARRERMMEDQKLELLFAGEGPNMTFVEAEVDGRSVRVGTWDTREDGLHVLSISWADFVAALGVSGEG